MEPLDEFEDVPIHVDPTHDAGWGIVGQEITETERLERGGVRPSNAPVLVGFSIGHTIAMDDTGARPLLVLGLELMDPHLGVETSETVLLAPRAGQLVARAIDDVLGEMGQPTVRDLRRVDL